MVLGNDVLKGEWNVNESVIMNVCYHVRIDGKMAVKPIQLHERIVDIETAFELIYLLATLRLLKKIWEHI